MSSTEGEVLPTEESARSFALVRRWTMRSATKLSLGSVAPDGSVTEEVEAEVASRPALVALKAVSIPRRKEGSYPEKVGSDIQDLYRLVEGLDLDVLLAELDTLETEARQWIAGVLTTTFSDKELRYAAMRMHRFAANVDSEGIAEGDLALLAELGAALADKP
jgi:hypothetical protein